MNEILSGISMILNLLVTAGLWWSARRSTTERPLWRSLAIAWTLNLLGNIAWVAYNVLTADSLPPLSPVDLFYFARYLFIGVGLWHNPKSWRSRRVWDLAGVLVAAAAVMWLTTYRDAWAATELSLLAFVGVAVYPILDVGLIYLAVLRVRDVRRGVLAHHATSSVHVLIATSMTLYGIANWMNFHITTGLLGRGDLVATVAWLLSDVTVVAALLLDAMHPRPAS